MTQPNPADPPSLPPSPPAPAAQRPLLDRLQPLILLILAGALTFWIVRDWDEFSVSLARFHVSRWWPLLVLLPTASLCGAAAWRAMMTGCGQPLAFGSAVRVWVLSQLGQYVPGTVWFAAGRVYLAGQFGAAPYVTTAVTLVEAVSYLSVGVMLTLGLAPAVGVLIEPRPVFIGLAVLGGIAAVYLGVPFLRRRAAARLQPLLARFPAGLPVSSLAAMMGLHLVCWVLASASFVTVVRSAYDLSGHDMLRIGIIQQVASFAGVLAFLLPQGLGAREGVMILGLSQVDAMRGATSADLAAIALVTRVAFTAWDGLFGLAVLTLTRPPPAKAPAAGGTQPSPVIGTETP